ncbi:MAG: HPt (histidine-containing phosphotransfer) domain-containing protein [Paracoccaceae bacterium]|jgi:HPt (histidine-containing phosphotransfer) domain-containing protein
MINWNRVRELEQDVGAEVIGEIVELFLEEVEGVIELLRAGNRGGSLAEDMHFLKGSALSLGFDRFGSMCGEGERLAANGQSDSVPVSAILAAYDVSKVEFLARMPPGSP